MERTTVVVGDGVVGSRNEVGSSFRDAPLWFFLSCLNALREVSALNLAQPAFQESVSSVRP